MSKDSEDLLKARLIQIKSGFSQLSSKWGEPEYIADVALGYISSRSFNLTWNPTFCDDWKANKKQSSVFISNKKVTLISLA